METDDKGCMKYLWIPLSIIAIFVTFGHYSSEATQPAFQTEETDISVINHEEKAVYFLYMGEYNGWAELSVLEELGYTHEVGFRDLEYGDNQVDPCPFIVFTHTDGTVFDSRDYEDQTMCVRSSIILRRHYSSGSDYDLSSPYRLIGTNMIEPMLNYVGYDLYVNGHGYHPVTLEWWQDQYEH
jgi:hypothetical protein